MNRVMEIGKSPNAIQAEKRGLFIKEDIEEKVLQQQGFLYSKDFFSGYVKKDT